MARTFYRKQVGSSNGELVFQEKGGLTRAAYEERDLVYNESVTTTTTVLSSRSLSQNASLKASTSKALTLKFGSLGTEDNQLSTKSQVTSKSLASKLGNLVTEDNTCQLSKKHKVAYDNDNSREWGVTGSSSSIDEASFEDNEDSFSAFTSNSYLLMWRKCLYFILSKPTHYDVELLSKINSLGKKKVIFLILLPLFLYLLFCALKNVNVEEFESGSDFSLLSSTIELDDQHDNLSNSWNLFPNLLSIFTLSSSAHHVTAEMFENTDHIIGENSYDLNPESHLHIENTLISKASSASPSSILNMSEVETLIRRLLLEELYSLPALQKTEKFNDQLNEKVNTILQEFATLKSDFKNFRENVNDKNIKDSEVWESIKTSQSDQKLHLLDKMQLMEEKLFVLESSLNNMKNCCRNESSLFPVIKNYISNVFENLVNDKESNMPFKTWLLSNFVVNEKFESSLNAIKQENQIDEVALKESIKHHIETLFYDTVKSTTTSKEILRTDNVTEIEILIKKAILLYDADKTGQTDYALESGGGSVVGTRCSETYTEHSARISILGIPLWPVYNSPRNAIQPSVHPGECWAFKGSQGYLVIQLAAVIKPTGFVVEHIPKSISASGNIDSAPKEFSVYGLISEKDYEGELLGKYLYDKDGEPLQYFPVQATKVIPYRFIELKIHSNQGSVNYTCLYRFRVHGLRA